jgi:hypothetical protein
MVNELIPNYVASDIFEFVNAEVCLAIIKAMEKGIFILCEKPHEDIKMLRSSGKEAKLPRSVVAGLMTEPPD